MASPLSNNLAPHDTATSNELPHGEQDSGSFVNDKHTYNNDDIEGQVHHPRHGSEGSGDQYIWIGRTKVPKVDILTAFGGSLLPGQAAPPSRKFGNPAPLGLSAFALTTFVLSLVNVQARSVTNASVVVGLAYFYGGLIQLLAGMWEMAIENTFGATALASYGGFWLSFAAIETGAFGIASSYTTEKELSDALAFYLMGWWLFTFILCSLTLRSTVAFFGLFFFLDVTFLFLAVGHFYADSLGGQRLIKAGGYFGIFTALIAWYNAYAGIANPENAIWSPTGIPMPFFNAQSKSYWENHRWFGKRRRD